MNSSLSCNATVLKRSVNMEILQLLKSKFLATILVPFLPAFVLTSYPYRRSAHQEVQKTSF